MHLKKRAPHFWVFDDMNVILASASPRRQELIKLIFDDFSVCPADIDETLPDGISADAAPVYLSEIKAKAVGESNPDALVLAADTVVISDGEILGKPADKADAHRMLKSLSGRTHRVITGCSIGKGGKFHSFSSVSFVTFYPLTDKEINDYIATGDPMDKAGAYGIQSGAAVFVEKIEGDYFNIVGLPVARLKREIEKFLI